jgi:hypothetical protein
MTKQQINRALKANMGFTKDKEIEIYRKVYLKIVKDPTEEDFYKSMISWFYDGSTGASYYDYWLKENWSD